MDYAKGDKRNDVRALLSSLRESGLVRIFFNGQIAQERCRPAGHAQPLADGE